MGKAQWVLTAVVVVCTGMLFFFTFHVASSYARLKELRGSTTWLSAPKQASPSLLSKQRDILKKQLGKLQERYWPKEIVSGKELVTARTNRIYIGNIDLARIRSIPT